MNPKKPYCRCGVLKTDETCSVRIVNGRKLFHYICMKCDNRDKQLKRLSKMSDEELHVLYERYSNYVEDIRNEIFSRI